MHAMTDGICDLRVRREFPAACSLGPSLDRGAKRARHPLAAIKGLDEDGFEKRDRRRLASIDIVGPHCRFGEAGVAASWRPAKESGIAVGLPQDLCRVACMIGVAILRPEQMAKPDPIHEMVLGSPLDDVAYSSLRHAQGLPRGRTRAKDGRPT